MSASETQAGQAAAQKAPSKQFMSEETRFTGHYSPSVFETLKFAYRHIFGLMAVLLLSGFVGRVLLLSNANIIGIWVDTFCQAPATCRPVPEIFKGLSSTGFFLLLLAVTVGGFFFTMVFRLFFSRASARAVSLLYDEVTLRTSRLPIRFFDTTPVGAVVTRFSSDYGNVFRLFGGPLAEFCVIIFDLLGMVLLVTVASPWFLPFFLLIALLNWLVYRLNQETLRSERRELSATRAPSIAHFSETAQGASTIRVFSRQSSFLKRFSHLNGAYLKRRMSTTSAIYRFSFQMSLLSALLLLVTGLSGYYLVTHGWVSVGSIGVAFTFIALSGASMQMFFEWMSQFEEAMTGVERLDNYLRRHLEPGLRLPASATFPTGHPQADPATSDVLRNGSFGHALNAEVRAENVWFRYGDDAPWVLKDVSFVIQPGERMGIVGRTGSGKSSLIQALFHLYPIAQGRFVVDGHVPLLDASRRPSPDEVDLERFRRGIALIAQEPVLFRGTLRENLALGQSINPSSDDRHSHRANGEAHLQPKTRVIDDAMMSSALERVGLGSWLADQPLGLGAQIEERGRNLSLGERQLLCMARCLLQASPVIIMDEATSAVDPQSEEILVRATEEFFKGRTQLIIAHRLSTLESCDRILWLKNGTVHRLDRADVILRELRETGEAEAGY